MNEAYIRGEISRLIRSLGFEDYHPPDFAAYAARASQETQGVTLGRPDLFGLNTIGPDVVIEVKTMEDVRVPWFKPARISNGQRNWLDWWCYQRHGYGYLAIGTIREPRSLWIIPWCVYETTERELGENDQVPNRIEYTLFTQGVFSDFICLRAHGKWVLNLGHSITNILTIPRCKEEWTSYWSLRIPEKEKKK